MEPTQQEIIQGQVAAKARHASMVVAATGRVAGSAFMTAVKGAETAGEKAVVFGALAGVASFFMPWVTLFGTVSGSGFRAAIDASWLFWLHPLSMVMCFFGALMTRGSGAKERILAARWYILVGTVWFTPGVAAVTNLFSGAIGIGGYLATLSAGAILIGGFLQVSESFARLDSSVPGAEGGAS